MSPQEPGFWLLDSRLGWHTSADVAPAGVAVGRAGGLRLAGDAGGPLSLMWLDDSLGGATLPRGMAWDDTGRLCLLSQRAPVIKRFDPTRRAFVALPTVGGAGSDARQFDQPANITVAGGNLYVADRGNRRVQVFALDRSLLLRYIWGPWDAAGRPASPESADTWDPADVASHNGQAYLLDARFGRVYRHTPGRDGLTRVVDEPQAAGRWERLALDHDGNLYLLDRGRACVDIYDPDGFGIGEANDAGDFRAAFDPPGVTLHYRTDHDDRTTGRFRLATADGELVFDREGRKSHFAPDEPSGPYLYTRGGVWLSEALDSATYRCQWHRIELGLTQLPPGTQVLVSTYAADATDDAAIAGGAKLPPPPDAGSALWAAGYTFTGTLQPPLDAAAQTTETTGQTPSSPGNDFLVQSGEGRYLWLKIEFWGNGYGTPVIEALRAYFPRDSYLRYLPAVYSSDDESRRFLEHFLAIFQTEWDALETLIATSARYFDPAAVPATGGWLENLAGWLALPLEGTWSEAQKRVLLEAASGVYPQRGTAAGLRAYVQAYLQNITGLTAAQQGDYPLLIEGFRERSQVMSLAPSADTAGASIPYAPAINVPRNQARLAGALPPRRLWGPAQVGRLQLDVFAQEGQARLISTGDPEHDIFTVYAHRFRVFLPAAWVQTADQETMVRRALDAEKPAQTVYDLCLVEPRFRVGIQSTAGMDTIIGAYPVTRLACGETTGSAAAAPSLPPRGRLGYDTILGGPRPEPFRLATAMRLEKDTILR
jgi:phage tail-like protein